MNGINNTGNEIPPTNKEYKNNNNTTIIVTQVWGHHASQFLNVSLPHNTKKQYTLYNRIIMGLLLFKSGIFTQLLGFSPFSHYTM